MHGGWGETAINPQDGSIIIYKRLKGLHLEGYSQCHFFQQQTIKDNTESSSIDWEQCSGKNHLCIGGFKTFTYRRIISSTQKIDAKELGGVWLIMACMSSLLAYVGRRTSLVGRGHSTGVEYVLCDQSQIQSTLRTGGNRSESFWRASDRASSTRINEPAVRFSIRQLCRAIHIFLCVELP